MLRPRAYAPCQRLSAAVRPSTRRGLAERPFRRRSRTGGGDTHRRVRPLSALTLATLNVWGIRGDWPARRGILSREFADIAPDLITLQETIVTADYDQA